MAGRGVIDLRERTVSIEFEQEGVLVRIHDEALAAELLARHGPAFSWQHADIAAWVDWRAMHEAIDDQGDLIVRCANDKVLRIKGSGPNPCPDLHEWVVGRLHLRFE